MKNAEMVSFEIDQTSIAVEDVDASIDLISDVEIETVEVLDQLDLTSLILNDETFRKIVALKIFFG